MHTSAPRDPRILSRLQLQLKILELSCPKPKEDWTSPRWASCHRKLSECSLKAVRIRPRSLEILLSERPADLIQIGPSKENCSKWGKCTTRSCKFRFYMILHYSFDIFWLPSPTIYFPQSAVYKAGSLQAQSCQDTGVWKRSCIYEGWVLLRVQRT